LPGHLKQYPVDAVTTTRQWQKHTKNNTQHHCQYPQIPSLPDRSDMCWARFLLLHVTWAPPGTYYCTLRANKHNRSNKIQVTRALLLNPSTVVCGGGRDSSNGCRSVTPFLVALLLLVLLCVSRLTAASLGSKPHYLAQANTACGRACLACMYCWHTSDLLRTVSAPAGNSACRPVAAAAGMEASTRLWCQAGAHVGD